MINENMIVEKSRDLIGMKTPKWKLSELKLLDIYLAKINARDEKSRTVRFTKREYIELMELTEVKAIDLKKNLESLISKTVYIRDKNELDHFKICNLFSVAYYHEDEHGEKVIDLSCSEDMKEAFFNLADNGYLMYLVKNSLRLNSTYAVKLYMYLKDNMFRSPFEIDLKTIRSTLEVDGIKTYNNFKYFKSCLLYTSPSPRDRTRSRMPSSA